MYFSENKTIEFGSDTATHRPVCSIACQTIEHTNDRQSTQHLTVIISPSCIHFGASDRLLSDFIYILICSLCVRLKLSFKLFLHTLELQHRYTSFLPRDASEERGYETACRLSVCPSVCPSVTFRYRDPKGLNSSKIILRPNSLRPMRSLTPNMGDLVQREHHQNWG